MRENIDEVLVPASHSGLNAVAESVVIYVFGACSTLGCPRLSFDLILDTEIVQLKDRLQLIALIS